MKMAQSIGKSITCHLGYNNFTFELWMILHKADCNGLMTHRSQYPAPLNRAYGENPENLNQYKSEDNFKRFLKKLTLKYKKTAISPTILVVKIAVFCVCRKLFCTSESLKIPEFSLQILSSLILYYGDGGIRTLVPRRANAFRVRPVMTASIRLHIHIICEQILFYLKNSIKSRRFVIFF